MSQHIKGAKVTERRELAFHAHNVLCLRSFTFRDNQEGFVFNKQELRIHS